YVTIDYSVAHPNEPFLRQSENCPSSAGKHYFTTKTRNGKRVSIDLCLLAMSFGERGEKLIPYKVDEKGMIWGAASYSIEVSEYAQQLENRFSLSPGDNDFVEKEIS